VKETRIRNSRRLARPRQVEGGGPHRGPTPAHDTARPHGFPGYEPQGPGAVIAGAAVLEARPGARLPSLPRHNTMFCNGIPLGQTDETAPRATGRGTPGSSRQVTASCAAPRREGPNHPVSPTCHSTAARAGGFFLRKGSCAPTRNVEIISVGAVGRYFRSARQETWGRLVPQRTTGKREERDTVISICAGFGWRCLELAFAALGAPATPETVGAEEARGVALASIKSAVMTKGGQFPTNGLPRTEFFP